MGVIRLVVADDHEIWLRGIEAELGQGFEVVATATDATGAIDAIGRCNPDLVLCDLRMPGGGGIEVVRACAATTKVVIHGRRWRRRLPPQIDLSCRAPRAPRRRRPGRAGLLAGPRGARARGVPPDDEAEP